MPEIASLAEAIRRWSLEVTGAAPITVACSQQHPLEMVGRLLSHGHVLRRPRAIHPPLAENLGKLGPRVNGRVYRFTLPIHNPPPVTGSAWRSTVAPHKSGLPSSTNERSG